MPRFEREENPTAGPWNGNPKVGVPEGAWRGGALGEGQLITTHPGSALAALKGKHKKFSGGFEGLGPGATTDRHLAAPRALRGPQL